MKPTAIIVKDGMGRKVNDHSPAYLSAREGDEGWHENPAYAEFEANVKSYPCPSIANTEPGRTILAELKWQYLLYGNWTDFDKENKLSYYSPRYSTRQIWVPIVEQKEGEGNRELKLENALRKLMSHYIENPDKQGKFWSKSHPSDDLLNEIKELL